MKLLIPLTVAGLSFSTASFAQFGTLDSDFDADGIVQTTFAPGISRVTDLALQSDEKIVAVGWVDNGTEVLTFVGRYLPDGTLDNTFGTNGYTLIDFDAANPQNNEAEAVAILSNGKIVVAGTAFIQSDDDAAVAQLNPDGSLDATFGNGGKALVNVFGGTNNNGVKDIAIDAAGKIVLAGTSEAAGNQGDFSLIRLNSDGSLDTSFDTDGRATIDFNTTDDECFALEILSSGKIVAVGSSGTVSGDFAAVMLNPDGSLDLSFSSDGKVTTDFEGELDIATNLSIQQDGKIVASGVGVQAGNATYDMAICRYNPNGSLDLTFSGDGKEIIAFDASDVPDVALTSLVQPDGKIIIGGYASVNAPNVDFGFVRFLNDGSLDNTFGTGGLLSTDLGGQDFATCMLIQPSDARLLVGGFSQSQITLARYLIGLNAGVFEFSAESSVLVYPNPVVDHISVQFQLKEEMQLSIELMDVNGRRVMQFVDQESFAAGEQVFEATVPAGLNQGTYFLKITSKEGSSSVQIMVSKS